MSEMDAGRPPGAPVPRATVPADVDLSRVWTGVAAQVWRRRPGPLERAAGWLLRSPGLARALVATPSLLLAWIIATVVVLFAGAGATLATGTPYVALLAPAVALTFGWLVPMTAVCALALAVATLSRSAIVGVAAGVAGWVIAVLSGAAAGGQLTTAVTDSALVLPYLASAACCGAVVLYATRIPRGTS